MKHDGDFRKIELYRDSIRRAWGHGDSNTWPVKLNAAFHLFLKEFGEELLEDVAWLEERGRTLTEIAEPFYNPARLYRIIDSTIYSMRRNGIPLAEQRKVVLKLLAMTKALKFGSEFNENGCNVIYGPKALKEVLSTKLGPSMCSSEESVQIHRFCGIMWAYTESIFFRAHDVTKEIHGPYYFGEEKKQLIVKEYLNLCPRKLWPTMPLLPCDTIKIYKQYNGRTEIRIDALNHLYQQGGSPTADLERYAIEVDGVRRDIAILEEYLAKVQQTIQAISHHIDGVSWNERVLKYAKIFWFRKKPLRDQRGLDWRVPAKVCEAIMTGSENLRRSSQLSKEASARLAMLTI